MTTQQWNRARSDVRRKTSRSKGRTSTRITGRGELSTAIGAREAHRDAGRVPMAIVDHALENVRETAHGADGDELARLADRWAHAIGAELPALIGNERNSWSEAGTMPTDPAILSSIAATTCGITGGIHLGVDVALGVHVTRKHKSATFPTRLRTAAYVKRAGDRPARTITTGRRTIRADVWRDPVTEQTRPRLKWTIHELPNVHADVDHATIGHGPVIARPPSARQRREDSARVTRDSVRQDAPVVDVIAATYDHAMRTGDPVGRWEWRANEDIRGVLSITKTRRLSVSGAYRVKTQRTLSAVLADITRQVAEHGA